MSNPSNNLPDFTINGNKLQEKLNNVKSDPELAETTKKIYKATKKPKIKEPKPIKPTGNRVFEPIINTYEEKEVDIEKEAISVEKIDNKTLDKIKDIARENPITNELMESAKQFFHDNKTMVEKQVQGLVALYNIADKRPFFFITPAEARMAIDYVKDVRNGLLQSREDEKSRDEFVRKVIDNISNDIVLETYTRLLSDEESIGINLKIDDLNLIFANMEKKDLIVDAIVISAIRYADIRSWGRTVYDECTYKEISERGILGRVWTADIHVSSKIPYDQIITINTAHEKVIRNILKPQNPSLA